MSGAEVCPFNDVVAQTGTDPFYPSKYVAVCAANGITTGKTASTFDPYSNITRAQVITMVVRGAKTADAYLEAPSPAYKAGTITNSKFRTLGDPIHGLNVQTAEMNNLFWGMWPDKGTSWDIYAKATRGEVAQILWRLWHEMGSPPGTTTFDWHHNPVTDHYYALTETGMSWNTLEALAVQTGGHLVSINDAAEEEWLYSTFGWIIFWIGLTDYPNEGEYRWTSGEPVTYLNWRPGEPNDGADGSGTADGVLTIPWMGGWDDEVTWAAEFWDVDAQKMVPSYPGVIEVENSPLP